MLKSFLSSVEQDHIQEIFATYGKIKMIDMPVERLHPNLSRGYAYVEFETPEEAQKALKHMDGGTRASWACSLGHSVVECFANENEQFLLDRFR